LKPIVFIFVSTILLKFETWMKAWSTKPCTEVAHQEPTKEIIYCTEKTMFWLIDMPVVRRRAGHGAAMCDRVPIKPLTLVISALCQAACL
jgi:hypothetical protein